MSKLWSKGYALDALVESFTVGEDYLLDAALIPADVAGSLAHATMLREAGLLGADDLESLKAGLLAVLDRHEKGDFAILPSDEDGHTAIENALVESCGPAGKRIHLGRSRNDQVALCVRLWMRDWLVRFVRSGAELVGSLLDFAETHRMVPMPGRTHMQPAMPSSVGLWAASWAETLLDDLRQAAAVHPLLDQCPLGSAAGYGVPLPLDRRRTASLLGFSRVQVNVASVGLTRGKFEARLLDAADQAGLTLSKLAQDLILFSLPEFGWFRLPKELCTGSSIMPQKRNPDALELMRAKSAVLTSLCLRTKDIVRSLPSGYNRDFQETKGPLMEGAALVLAMLAVTDLTVRQLEVDAARLEAAFDPSIFATDAAIELVAGGMAFRDAYLEVGTHPERLRSRDPKAALASRTSLGTSGNLGLDEARAGLAALAQENEGRDAVVRRALADLLGRPVVLA